MGPLKSAVIENFKGIIRLEIHPDGRSVVFRGPNGTGKTSAIDALAWGLGINLDEEVIRNGADKAKTKIAYEGYVVERQKKRGGKPTIKVSSPGIEHKDPTALVRGFSGAIDRRTFSRRPPKERVEILRKLCPGLDVSDLAAKRAEVYERRTGVNAAAKALEGQLAGIVVPEAPPEPGREVSVAELVKRQREASAQKAANDRARQQAAQHRSTAKEAARESIRLEEALARAHAEAAATHGVAQRAEEEAAALVDPDLAALDAELAGAEEHNAAVRQAAAACMAVARAKAERSAKSAEVDKRKAESEALTRQIEALDAEKGARLAAVKLPIRGLAFSDGVVTLDDGEHGPVEVEGLNSEARIRLDVAIGAALGNRLVSVPDASLLDAERLAALEAFACERGVQLLEERVVDPTPGQVPALVAVIEEQDPLEV